VSTPTTNHQPPTTDHQPPTTNHQPQTTSGSSSITKMTAQTQATPTLSEQTRRDIDSLRGLMEKTTVPADRARIGYQLGLRYRLAGDHTAAIEQLVATSRTAKEAGALVLAAKSSQQAAKAASQLGDRQRAVALYNDALQMLPTTETSLRDRWMQERDALQR
jgi:tetratricopeptide (TPR) repeat protein